LTPTTGDTPQDVHLMRQDGRLIVGVLASSKAALARLLVMPNETDPLWHLPVELR